MRLIDAEGLMKAMYHRAFETDGDTMWQSGCWVRYRAIEQTVKEQPTIEAAPVAFKGFAEWVADWVLRSDFEESAGGFAELACRRLEAFGIMRKDGNKWVRNEVEK